jgi:putative transposase
MGHLCLLLGITRQAYYQYYWWIKEQSFEGELVIQEVMELRKKHPRMGARKLYQLLEPFMLENQIKMGRDALFDLLAANQLLVRRRKRRIRTTYSGHGLGSYPNLLKGMVVSQVNQVWVSDITYWKTDGRYLYISLVTDVYSHKIVGYQVSESLEARGCIQALEMAIRGLNEPIKELIHHSDRGIQYCSSEYIIILKRYGIKISMSQKGTPLDNAIAERINGIIKGEYLYNYPVKDLTEARESLEKVVKLYNEERPHLSISNKPPSQVHESNQETVRLWKNYYSNNLIVVKQLQDSIKE